MNILKNGRKLNGSNMYCKEHLSRTNVDIASFARQLKRRQRIYSTWMRNSKVLVKTNGAPHVARIIMIRDNMYNDIESKCNNYSDNQFDKNLQDIGLLGLFDYTRCDLHMIRVRSESVLCARVQKMARTI